VNARHAASTKFMDGKIQGLEASLAERKGNVGSGRAQNANRLSGEKLDNLSLNIEKKASVGNEPVLEKKSAEFFDELNLKSEQKVPTEGLDKTLNNYRRLKDKADASRSLLPTKYQKEDMTGFKLGNTAYAEVNIKNHFKGELKSFSKYGNLNKNGEVTSVPGWVSSKKLEDRRYYKDVLKVNSDNQIDLEKGYLRDKDTEYKIIEGISDKLKDNYDAEGVIHLYTERDVCLSCDNVLKSFSTDYKNITLNIYDALGNIYKLRNGSIITD
ncbi:deaminase domain-containing protein, partial [Bacillus pseudomycoides]